MSETDPAASSEQGSDLLAELARQKERIARLESLLAEADRRIETPRTDQSAQVRPKSPGNTGQAPVRLSELGPPLQGFAEAVMAYTAPKSADPPPKARETGEPTVRLTHEQRHPIHSPRPSTSRGPRRGGLMALLLCGTLLTAIFAGAGVLYNRFLAANLDSVPSPAAKHYRPVPADPVEPPEVLPVEESAHTLASRPPSVSGLSEPLQSRNALTPLPASTALSPAEPKKPEDGFRSHRRRHRRHKAIVPAAPKPEPSTSQPTPVDARPPKPSPGHYRIVEPAPSAPATRRIPRIVRRVDRPSAPMMHRRLQIALAGNPVAHKPVAPQPSPPKKPPLGAHRHPRRTAGSYIPSRTHPGNKERADAWMDRLP